MPGGPTQRRVAAFVAAACVFAVICPCKPESWRMEVLVVAFAGIMSLVLYANDTKVSIVVTMALVALALHWKSSKSSPLSKSKSPLLPVDKFTVRAPHNMLPDDPNSPEGRDTHMLESAGARISFGAGSQPLLPDPGISVEDLKQLTPPELLLAAQTNTIPDKASNYRRPIVSDPHM